MLQEKVQLNGGAFRKEEKRMKHTITELEVRRGRAPLLSDTFNG